MGILYVSVPSSQDNRRRRSRGQGRFACHACDRRYHQEKNLKRHMINECGKQPKHQCIYCPYKATYKSYLQIHMMKHRKHGLVSRNHNFNEIHIITENTSNTTTATATDTNNMIIENVHHTDTKYQLARFKHTCETCGKSYKHKHHLKRHHDFECGIEPKFSCDFCDHRTRYKDSLTKHVLARHQHLLEQNTQYAGYLHRQTSFDSSTTTSGDFNSNQNVQGSSSSSSVFVNYSEFS
ncbi:hypothetical protein M0802_011719 [Mischocyttarus mexicanus]|nr:hypothetical protein M0802_011719 [Mischocyttarus mexicanus]